jgi:hypothetical protein
MVAKGKRAPEVSAAGATRIPLRLAVAAFGSRDLTARASFGTMEAYVDNPWTLLDF